jgi:hypothetical protein
MRFELQDTTVMTAEQTRRLRRAEVRFGDFEPHVVAAHAWHAEACSLIFAEWEEVPDPAHVIDES